MELINSLDTQASVDAVLRFGARRRQPMVILSANGTNFFGAANEFKTFLPLLKEDETTKHVAEEIIKWSLNPTAAPHFVSAWKQLFRSSNKPMYNIL